MPKLNYLLKVVKGASFEKLNHCIDVVNRRSGKSKAAILADMAHCMLKYGAGYYDYMIFEYENMDASQRATYMTRMVNKKMTMKLNDQSYTHIFDYKNEFYHTFKDFLKRDFLDTAIADKESVEKFLEGKEYVIVKPSDGECGKGIEKIKIKDFASLKDAAEYILDKNNNFGVVEDFIVQHPKMSSLYPDSVNCLRMATVVVNKEAHLLYAVLKTGNNGNFVDNLESGGYACHVDLATHKVCGPGHTSSSIMDAQLSEIHPATGVSFRGFEVPYLDEAAELVKKAAMVLPQVGYIGWDVAITENGPAIIEGNNYCAYDFPQLPDDGWPKFGLLGMVRKAGVEI